MLHYFRIFILHNIYFTICRQLLILQTVKHLTDRFKELDRLSNSKFDTMSECLNLMKKLFCLN